MTRLILQDFPAVPDKAGYQIRLVGDLKGTAGFIKTADGGVNDATFTLSQIDRQWIEVDLGQKV